MTAPSISYLKDYKIQAIAFPQFGRIPLSNISALDIVFQP